MKLFRQDELPELGCLQAIDGAVVLDGHGPRALEQVLAIHDALNAVLARTWIIFDLGFRGCGSLGSHHHLAC